MKKYLALLRGINVSGHKIIRMAELRAALEQGGLHNVSTYIQSGNILFSSEMNALDSSRLISTIILEKFGFEVAVVTITPEELASVIAANPFEISKKLYVVFADSGFLENGELLIGDDIAVVRNGCFFIRYSDGAGSSKLTNHLIEKKYGVTSTMRNWNTVVKLHELLKSENKQ